MRARLAALSSVVLAHVFTDEAYNRTGLTLVGQVQEMEACVAGSVCGFISSLDLTKQSGKHPRLGVVDHVVVHPLTTQLSECAKAARRIGMHVSSVAKGQNPAFFLRASIFLHCRVCEHAKM